MLFADLDAVTVDAFGTIVTLENPVGALAGMTGRDEVSVQRAFEAEVAFYLPRSLTGRDAEILAALRARCFAVFNDALGSSLSRDEFVSALRYEELPGARAALERLRSRGLALAVVANWDCALPEHLDRLGLACFFTAIVTSAEGGAAKPDPRPFRIALERLGVEPGRALHVGDGDEDERGAAAAGMRFARAPLSNLV